MFTVSFFEDVTSLSILSKQLIVHDDFGPHLFFLAVSFFKCVIVVSLSSMNYGVFLPIDFDNTKILLFVVWQEMFMHKY